MSACISDQQIYFHAHSGHDQRHAPVPWEAKDPANAHQCETNAANADKSGENNDDRCHLSGGFRPDVGGCQSSSAQQDCIHIIVVEDVMAVDVVE